MPAQDPSIAWFEAATIVPFGETPAAGIVHTWQEAIALQHRRRHVRQRGGPAVFFWGAGPPRSAQVPETRKLLVRAALAGGIASSSTTLMMFPARPLAPCTLLLWRHLVQYAKLAQHAPVLSIVNYLVLEG